jgi:uncharacterized membrane-anchored protein YjiN (DUF445 family)
MSVPVPRLRDEQSRWAELRTMRRRASLLLAAVAVAFGVLVVLGDDHGGWGYALAAAEGSLVGGLADWFAVTALFRHPLGIPIPHTAVVRSQKDRFGATIGQFVQENFLNPDNLGERVSDARPAERAAAWLSLPANAETASRWAGEVLVNMLDALRDEDVHQLLHEELERLAERTPLAPVAGRLLDAATSDGRHHPALDAGLRAAGRLLDQNRVRLKEGLDRNVPWWIPESLEHRLVDRMLDGATDLCEKLAANPDHELRKVIDRRLADVIDRLQHDPDLQARFDTTVRDLLDQPALRGWLTSAWTEAKEQLHQQACDPASRLRRRMAEGVMAAGGRLSSDAELRTRVDTMVHDGVRHLAERYHDEVSDLISSTIERWDAEQTSEKLELLLGPDLQYIRINGTVVGGLAGVAIHALALVFG